MARVFWRIAVLLAAGSLVAACTGSAPRHAALNAKARSHACTADPLRRGDPPAWTQSANPPTGLPFVVASQDNVAGFVFGNPLTADTRRELSNKVLWVVRTPRAGEALKITANPVGADGPAVRVSVPAASGPGEIYPSIVNVPTPGCWHFTLRWHNASASLTLR
jgi:hypothetical protein